MNTPINAILLGKLIDRSVDPSSHESEVKFALRKAHQICQAANKMPSDAIILEGEVYFEASILPKKKILDQIAELKIAVWKAEERERAYLIQHRSELDAERGRSSKNEAALRLEIDGYAEQMAQRDAQIAKLEALIAGVKAANGFHNGEVPPEVSAAAEIQAPIEDDDSCAIANKPEVVRVGPKVWSRFDWTLFERLAAAGASKIKIARELTRILGRTVTIVCVGELGRIRWSPKSGRRFAMRTI